MSRLKGDTSPVLFYIDQQQLAEQVRDYHTISSSKAWRKQAAYIFSFIALLHFVFGNTQSNLPVDTYIIPAAVILFVYLIITFFIYKGHKWSMIIGLMLIIADLIYTVIDSFNTSSSFAIPIFAIIIYYLAGWETFKSLKVELARKKK